MAVDNIIVPSSGGGLVRYSEEYKSKIQIKPEFIIVFTILVILFEIVIRII
jgi:preprotein translocase subunit Sec61beta